MPDTVPSKFKKFMDAQNGGKALLWQPGINGNIFARAIQNNAEGSYDTYHSTEYDRQLPSSYGSTFTEQLWSAARTKDGEKVLDAVEFDGKNGWKNTETLTTADLEGYRVTNVRYNKYGNTAILQKDGKEPVRVKLPKGINLGAERNVSAAIANADEYGMILAKGKRPMMNADKTGFVRDVKGEIMFTNENLTPDDRMRLKQFQRQALNEMESYGSQFVRPSETETDKYKPFGF